MAEVIQLKISFAILKFKQLLYNIVYNIYWKIKYKVAVTINLETCHNRFCNVEAKAIYIRPVILPQ